MHCSQTPCDFFIFEFYETNQLINHHTIYSTVMFHTIIGRQIDNAYIITDVKLTIINTSSCANVKNILHINVIVYLTSKPISFNAFSEII